MMLPNTMVVETSVAVSMLARSRSVIGAPVASWTTRVMPSSIVAASGPARESSSWSARRGLALSQGAGRREAGRQHHEVADRADRIELETGAARRAGRGLPGGVTMARQHRGEQLFAVAHPAVQRRPADPELRRAQRLHVDAFLLVERVDARGERVLAGRAAELGLCIHRWNKLSASSVRNRFEICSFCARVARRSRCPEPEEFDESDNPPHDRRRRGRGRGRARARGRGHAGAGPPSEALLLSCFWVCSPR